MHDTNRVAYRADDSVFFPDTCEPLRLAAERGGVDLRARARGHYPGDRLPEGALEGIRTVGFWDAHGDQAWGLDWHRNEGIELTYVSRGVLDFAVGDAAYTLRPGDLTVTRPWQRHRVGQPNVTASRLHWLILDVGVRRPNQTWTWPSWCILSPELMDELTGLLQYNEQPVWPAADETAASFEKLGRAVANEDAGTGDTRIAIAVNELLLSLVEMLRDKRIPLDRSLTSSRRSVEMFLDSLPHHVGVPWTLDEMAEACGLGRTQFTAYCREVKNATPVEYLSRCRVDMAAHLLRTTSRTVTDVSFRCGFDSSQYFATVFKKHTGVSPSDYRSEARPANEPGPAAPAADRTEST